MHGSGGGFQDLVRVKDVSQRVYRQHTADLMTKLEKLIGNAPNTKQSPAGFSWKSNNGGEDDRKRSKRQRSSRNRVLQNCIVLLNVIRRDDEVLKAAEEFQKSDGGSSVPQSAPAAPPQQLKEEGESAASSSTAYSEHQQRSAPHMPPTSKLLHSSPMQALNLPSTALRMEMRQQFFPSTAAAVQATTSLAITVDAPSFHDPAFAVRGAERAFAPWGWQMPPGHAPGQQQIQSDDFHDAIEKLSSGPTGGGGVPGPHHSDPFGMSSFPDLDEEPGKLDTRQARWPEQAQQLHQLQLQQAQHQLQQHNYSSQLPLHPADQDPPASWDFRAARDPGAR